MQLQHRNLVPGRLATCLDGWQNGGKRGAQGVSWAQCCISILWGSRISKFRGFCGGPELPFLSFGEVDEEARLNPLAIRSGFQPENMHAPMPAKSLKRNISRNCDYMIARLISTWGAQRVDGKESKSLSKSSIVLFHCL